MPTINERRCTNCNFPMQYPSWAKTLTCIRCWSIIFSNWEYIEKLKLKKEKKKRLYIASLECWESILWIVAYSYKEARKEAFRQSEYIDWNDLTWWEFVENLRVKWRKDIDATNLPIWELETLKGIELWVYSGYER